jgi:competence protein ComEA
MKQIILGLISMIPLLAMAGPVNINTADAESMARELNGIGMAKAEAIVAYRNEHGPFNTPEELVKVKGIGDRVLEQNRGEIRVAD